MADKKKYALLVIDELNGERSYTHYLVREIPTNSSIDEMIVEACKEHVGYEEEEDEDKDSKWIFSPTGEIAATPGMSREITEEEFNVLNKFL